MKLDLKRNESCPCSYCLLAWALLAVRPPMAVPTILVYNWLTNNGVTFVLSFSTSKYTPIHVPFRFDGRDNHLYNAHYFYPSSIENFSQSIKTFSLHSSTIC